jgi:hypothetical protein
MQNPGAEGHYLKMSSVHENFNQQTLGQFPQNLEGEAEAFE